MTRLPELTAQPLSFRLRLAAVIMLVIGVAGLAIGFTTGQMVEAWLWLNILFVVFLGIAQAMIVWAAVFRVAQARWTPAVNRIGHSVIGFMPIMYIVLIILVVGIKEFAPWATHPVTGKAEWLNVPFMAARNLIGVAVLFLLDYLMVRFSLLADAKVRRGEDVTDDDQHRLNVISLIVIFAYAAVGSVIAYDFIMALSPEWVSTMFAPYFWISNLYAAMGVMIILSGALRKSLRMEQYLGKSQFQDMGNLMLAFGFFSMGLFFAQYLTIWYGNLPWETRFLIVRYYKGPWPYLGWTAFILQYIIPFVLLQSRIIKRNPKFSIPVAVIALIGFILERYVLIVPSLAPGSLLISPVSAIGFLAFLGAFVLVIAVFFSRYSPISAAQAALPELEPLEVSP
ncbi:MAG: hypothetical protein Q7N50_07955 [Armatimonadota bacterium]|nr:hypothetical protein [Armatimonadota bacterium]